MLLHSIYFYCRFFCCFFIKRTYLILYSPFILILDNIPFFSSSSLSLSFLTLIVACQLLYFILLIASIFSKTSFQLFLLFYFFVLFSNFVVFSFLWLALQYFYLLFSFSSLSKKFNCPCFFSSFLFIIL